MKIRLIAGFLCLLYCFSLFSCSSDSDNELPKEETKENTWYWGYFKGEINGQNVSLENKDYNGPIHSNCSGYYLSWDVLPDSINIISTLIHYNDSSEVRITLYDLTPGERYLTLSNNAYWYQSCIRATVFDSTPQRTVKAKYIPSVENPFRVEIIDVLWLSRAEPIIEVKLDGILYNKESKNDTLVIKGIYGTR